MAALAGAPLLRIGGTPQRAPPDVRSGTWRATTTMMAAPPPTKVKLVISRKCALGISVYPDFGYDASSGEASGTCKAVPGSDGSVLRLKCAPLRSLIIPLHSTALVYIVHRACL